MAEDFETQVAGVAALAEPARRALYRYVVAQAGPVSRDQAAAGAGLPRHTAKFHLDKLVEEGLLETEFRRRSGRRGPGAGRPAKLYRRSARELAVSLPERRYDLAGHILAQALESAAGGDRPVLETLSAAAEEAGRAIAAQARDHAPAAGGSGLDSLVEILASHGYEPRHEEGAVVLANCPFHVLAREHTEIVCRMNLDVIAALTGALDLNDVEVRLDPAPQRCCVRLCAR